MVSWKILIVDDDEDDYLIARVMLSEAQGARVQLEWASTFEAGRAALSAGGYDAVLMDYDLGAGNGLDLIREVVASGSETPIILLTGRGSHEIDVEAMQAGATMYLTKNEANSLLLERVIRYAIEIKQNERAIKEREAHLLQASQRLEQELADRKLAEARLRDNEEWLRLALEATDLGTWQFDLQTNTYTFDPRAQRHYGFSRREIPNAEAVTHIHPADAPALMKKIDDTFAQSSDGRFSTTYRVVHPDGTTRTLSVKAQVYFEAEGADRHPVLVVGTSQDVTERRASDEALARQAQMQAALVDISHGILTAGRDLAALTGYIFDKVSPLLDVDMCLNYRVDQDSGSLTLIAGIGIPADQWDTVKQLDLGQAFCGTVAATGRPLIADAQRIATDDLGIVVRTMGIRAYACHPLFARGGRVLGTLSFCSTRRTEFTPQETNFIQTLCHFVALAWERAGEASI